MVSAIQAPIFRWVVAPRPDRSAVAGLVERLHLPDALAALLVQRGQGNADEARKYLRPAIDDLSDPHALAGMAEAVDAIASTVRAGGTIMVHGDYDVDGQCATAVLTRALHATGADVVPFVPHRLRDGYDFGSAGLNAARAAGASLVITCDCGITAVETVREARAVGIAVVVTDHHLPGDELPPAAAVVDPQRPDDSSGLTTLCGTGDAADGLRLLLSDNMEEATALARRLEGLNTERQALDQRILDEALSQVEQMGDLERDASFVLAAEGWHPGVVGIVASRVVERFGRPAFLIAFDGDIGKGSGRSISRFDLHAALHACGDLLERYGGHQMAAGLTIRRDRLDEFRERFGAIARDILGPDDLGPEQR